MIKQKATKIEPKPANKEYILKNRFKLQNLVILIFEFIFSSSPKNTEGKKENTIHPAGDWNHLMEDESNTDEGKKKLDGNK